MEHGDPSILSHDPFARTMPVLNSPDSNLSVKSFSMKPLQNAFVRKARQMLNDQNNPNFHDEMLRMYRQSTGSFQYDMGDFLLNSPKTIPQSALKDTKLGRRVLFDFASTRKLSSLSFEETNWLIVSIEEPMFIPNGALDNCFLISLCDFQRSDIVEICQCMKDLVSVSFKENELGIFHTCHNLYRKSPRTTWSANVVLHFKDGSTELIECVISADNGPIVVASNNAKVIRAEFAKYVYIINDN